MNQTKKSNRVTSKSLWGLDKMTKLRNNVRMRLSKQMRFQSFTKSGQCWWRCHIPGYNQSHIPEYTSNIDHSERNSVAMCSARYTLDDLIHFSPHQHDDGYIDGRSQIRVHTDGRTQVHSVHSLPWWSPGGPSLNRGRRCLTPVNVRLSYI